MKNLLATLTCTALVLACSATGRSGWKRYGGAQELRDSDSISAAKVLAQPDTYDGKTVAVVGTPREVCLKKGCWMLFSEDGRELRVTFKDYAFFVPTDTAGKIVRCEGTFAIADIPPAEAMHYLEDAGRHDDAAKIRGPVKGYTLVATSVEVREE